MQIDLRKVVMFSKLPEQGMVDVIALLKPRKLAAGEILFHQGERGDELIVVEQGSIAIFVPVPGAVGGGQPIRIFRPGEMLGEMALIDQKPRSASVRAEEPSQVLALGGDDFRHILVENPQMALSVMAGLSDRIRYTTEFLGEVRQWVQRMSEGNYHTQGITDEGKYHDQTLASLAAEFAQMATRVQQREDALRQQVDQLRIEIDETRRRQESQRIMGSEYYQSLKEKAKSLREKNR